MTQLNDISKEYLQSLPIWQYFDEMKTQLSQLKYDWQQYSTNLQQVSTSLSRLPEININRQPVSNDPATNDCDIVREYKKKDGEYCRYEVPAEPNDDKESMAVRNRSISMLEQKVKADEEIYAMIQPDQPWVKCKIICVFRRPPGNAINKPMITFKIRGPSELESRVFHVDKYAVARIQDHGELLKSPKRVIAGIRKTALFAGIIGQEPFSGNLNRYLVHMDDGSARYFRPNQIYPILGQSRTPWRDARFLRNEDQDNEACLRLFYNEYPTRRLMKIRPGDQVDIHQKGNIVKALVADIDCDVARIVYRDGKEECIYRGSPRWLADKHSKAKQLRNAALESRYDGLTLYIHLYEQAGVKAIDEDLYRFCEDFDKKIIVSRNHNRATKSTARNTTTKKIKINLDGQYVDEDRDTILNDDGGDNHRCTPSCLSIPGKRTETMITDIRAEFRDESDLKVPLLLGWKRGLYTVPTNNRNGRPKILIKYEAPCGKIFSQYCNIRRYLINTGSIMDIDYFSFEREIELNSKNGMCYTNYFIPNIAVNSKTGRPLENKNISLVNAINEERLPADFEYRNESFPHPMLEAKGFSFNEEFKSSCDCEDDCYHRSICACHRLNEEFYGKNHHNRGTVSAECQYKYKRLFTQVPTGIFECNSNCKCSSKCSNRVVQNGIRFRLQVRKTLSKGWGVITLDDIPPGAFICTYSAELLDDADQYGDSDMYYADLDYISVNEDAKEKFSDSDEGVDSDSEDDLPSANGKRKNVPRIEESDGSGAGENKKDGSDSSSISSLDDDVIIDKYLPREGGSEQKSRYPKRKVSAQCPDNQVSNNNNNNRNRETRVRFKKIHDLLGTHDYTLDARMQGNVGRFFNHSCDPNAYVQNVFLETHDLRFPVVAFFAIRTIKATDEITWNYNYKMGSIQGRRIDCHCGAPNCRGRIL